MNDQKVVRMTLPDIEARQLEDLRQRDPGLVARIEAQDRLARAAPEMLRALLAAQSFIEQTYNLKGNGGLGGPLGDKIRSAIAKATGGDE